MQNDYEYSQISSNGEWSDQLIWILRPVNLIILSPFKYDMT